MVEIAGKEKAQHPPHAHRHDGITQEVKVDLQAVTQHVQPGAEGVLLHELAHFLREGAQGIGQQHLRRQSADEQRHAHFQGFSLRSALFVEGLGQIGIPHDRPGDELGEHEQERSESEQVPFTFRLLPVYVHQIACGLEGKKADAQGQGLSNRRACANQRSKEAHIFKQEQTAHIRRHAQRQYQFSYALLFCFFQQQSAAPVHNQQPEKQRYEPGVAPGIKKQAGKKQKRILQPFGKKQMN